MKKVIGVDIGGTKIRIGVINENGEVVADQIIPTQSPLYPYLEEEILKVQADFPELSGIGIGTRGMVNAKTGIVTFEKYVEGGDGTPLKAQ